MVKVVFSVAVAAGAVCLPLCAESDVVSGRGFSHDIPGGGPKPWTHLNFQDDADDFHFAIVPDRSGTANAANVAAPTSNHSHAATSAAASTTTIMPPHVGAKHVATTSASTPRTWGLKEQQSSSATI